MQNRAIVMATTALLLTIAPAVSNAQQDWNGNEAQGLGHPHPSTANVSLSDNWKAYRFDRDGIRYYQVNDRNDNVHVVVGKVDEIMWALPAGKPSARTSLPSWRLKISEEAVPTLVYSDEEISLIHYQDGSNTVWSVEEVP